MSQEEIKEYSFEEKSFVKVTLKVTENGETVLKEVVLDVFKTWQDMDEFNNSPSEVEKSNRIKKYLATQMNLEDSSSISNTNIYEFVKLINSLGEGLVAKIAKKLEGIAS